MGTESPAQSMLNQGTQGSGLTTHPPLGSMMSNSSGSPGVETISSAQHNPQFSGQLSSSQGQVPQNMGSSVGGGMNQLNYQQGLGQSQMIGQGGQQKTGMVAMRDRQQHQMLSSSNLQVQHNMGSNPIQSPTSSQSPLHRSSSAPRLGQLQHYNSPSIRPGQYVASQQSLGGIPFNHPLQQQQQQLGGVARSNMMGQGQGPGHLSMHSGQPGQLSNFPSQYLSQARQKQGPIQGSQFQQAVSSGQPLQGMQTIGMMGSMGLGSQIRNSGALAYQQQRVGQGPLRSQPPSQQQSVTSPQKLQAQSLPRVSSLGAGNSQLPGLSQGGQSTMIPSSLSQPQWLKMHPSSLPSSASPSYQLQQQQRQQQAQSQQQPPPPSLQQQQQSTALHQQQLPQQTHSSQQLQMQQQQVQQSLQQQQMSRLPSSSIQKPATPTGSQPGTPASGATTPAGSNSQGTEASNHILGKRSIQDLVAQVDSHEKLDPEVEDILLEMADDFIHSVTTFACALAKHRKSATLEAKDILLHLERNWQLTIPGFTGEEFKTHKRSSVSETHLQRLAMIQKSMTASQMENEAGNIKGTTGQVIGSSNAGVQVAKVSQSTAPVIPSSTGSPGVHKVPRLF